MRWNFRWDCGRGELQALGGMLGPVWFDLSDGRSVQPFFVAPWADEPDAEVLPGLLRRMRGEWPCVPFGIEERALPAPWQGGAPSIGDGHPHGFGPNHDWVLVDKGIDWIEIAIDYPESHPVRRLRRRIAGSTGNTRVEISLTVEARQGVDLGFALHPVLKLPDTPGGAEIRINGELWGMTFPQALDPTSRAAAGARFDRLAAVPASSGGTIDLSRLPLATPNEDLVQIAATDGVVTLENYEEGYRVHLDYDATLFPSVVLWITNCGWKDFPWNARTRALGIEPARAAFDLGQGVSADPDNPLARSVPTALRLEAGDLVSTTYSISVSTLS